MQKIMSAKKSNNTIQSITVFVTFGSKSSLDELCSIYERTKGRQVIINYASSGVLAKQISAGAKTVLFVSANKKWIDYLSQHNLIEKASVKEIAKNSLAIIVSKSIDVDEIVLEPEFDITALIKDKIALADPAVVPSGQYAEQALESLGWFEKLKDRTVLFPHVLSVLRCVEAKECDCGIVYRSDASASDKIEVAVEIPDALHDPILFYIAKIA